ncbi:septum-promoting GTP-binding protein 1 [Cocos nucifera]|uniref:Septum-promoting GTP-binding protein 1 n=1 Tax=Cocos nucifera TaxID=13894 RepID=A0A8K0IVB5_COCNU|nr:septum-promoting GTP-binding protein 1 [Cocos nucifera]
MTHFSRNLLHLDHKWACFVQLALVRRFFHLLWDRLLACSCGHARYRRLNGSFSPQLMVIENAPVAAAAPAAVCSDVEVDSDLVPLKVSLLGDCHIGKTSFMVKYVGDVEEQRGLQMTGLNLMDKILAVRGARIAFSIWDVGGDRQFLDHVPVACKDAAAILIMFDLTSRCTLNKLKYLFCGLVENYEIGKWSLSRNLRRALDLSICAIGWYQRARKWNKTAIPILIGTKFDDFVQLPLEMQWTIVNQMEANGGVGPWSRPELTEFRLACQSMCKSDECNSLFFKCHPQHKCEQDIQVHHSQAL